MKRVCHRSVTHPLSFDGLVKDQLSASFLSIEYINTMVGFFGEPSSREVIQSGELRVEGGGLRGVYVVDAHFLVGFDELPDAGSPVIGFQQDVSP